jgi:hypothetical protein
MNISGAILLGLALGVLYVGDTFLLLDFFVGGPR